MTRSLRAAVVLVLLVGGLRATPTAAQDPIRLEPVVSGLSNPLYVTHARDDRLFVVEQAGRIRLIVGGQLVETPFLDIQQRVRSGGEQGLLGLAFHPDYSRNGRFFVNYTRQSDDATVVAEYKVSPNANVAQNAERVLLVVAQPFTNNNGGMIEFGPDRFLYIGLGDGGSAGDPRNRAQNKGELLGKILRIDVDGAAPYAIPPDNPFAGGGGRPEIFALGFRNPWRFSFDRQRGDLWLGDVGQNSWEEISIIRRGENHGWRVMEGTHCFHPRKDCTTSELKLPVVQYRNTVGRCAVTGGYVYRGSRIPSLANTYVYGDYCTGEIFAFARSTVRVLLTTKLWIASFGEDQSGELYVVNLKGSIHRLVGPPQ
jgi:glucose/arabinose dehydrogenase